jgi:hypothetical protein
MHPGPAQGSWEKANLNYFIFSHHQISCEIRMCFCKMVGDQGTMVDMSICVGHIEVHRNECVCRSILFSQKDWKHSLSSISSILPAVPAYFVCDVLVFRDTQQPHSTITHTIEVRQGRGTSGSLLH